MMYTRVCAFCGNSFETKYENKIYCTYSCKQKAKARRQYADPVRRKHRQETWARWFDNHPEQIEIMHNRGVSHWKQITFEQLTDINERRRRRRWKNGSKKSSSPDLPINNVYLHTFPNGKVYVGITKNTELRWDNGEGYANNPQMYEDIKKFGWDNIKHEVIANGLLRNEALGIETQYIFMYDATNPLKGYNRKNCSKVV